MSDMTGTGPSARFCSVGYAVFYANGVVSRSKLYYLAAEHGGLFKKFDHRTIVDLDVLDAIIAALPNAVIGTPKSEA